MKKHFLIPILNWTSKQTDGFSPVEFFNEFKKLTNWQQKLINNYFDTATENYNNARKSRPHQPETIFYQITDGLSRNDEETKYILTTDALFNLIDYKELELARTNAVEAKRLAIIAIIFSISIPLLIATFLTQTVSIEPRQYNEIIEIINSLR